MNTWKPAYPDVPTAKLAEQALAAQAAAESGKEDLSYLVDLQARLEPPTFEMAAQMLDSDDSGRRRLGCRILGELRASGPSPFASKTRRLMMDRLQADEDPTVIRAALVALGRNIDVDSLDALLAYAGHADADLRIVVAEFAADVAESENALNARAVATLLTLTEDDDADVRWYAVSASAYDVRVDNDQIHAALSARTQDKDKKIREIATHALRVRDEGAYLL